MSLLIVAVAVAVGRGAGFLRFRSRFIFLISPPDWFINASSMSISWRGNFRITYGRNTDFHKVDLALSTEDGGQFNERF